MADAKAIPTRGMTTAMNPLAGSGGWYRLENMVADLPGWATKRRGIKNLSPLAAWTSVMSQSGYLEVSGWCFDDHIWVYGENAGGYGALAAYSMVTNAGWHKVFEVTPAPRLEPSQWKLRSCPSDRRQLIPTSSGVKRIAGIYDDYYPKGSTTNVNYSTMYRDAGVPRALDPRCRNAVAGGATDHGLITLTGFEWLTVSSAVAYRVAWFKRDENGIPAISAPSGRIVVRNTSTTTNYATRLKINIPAGVTDSSYVLQIYRTNVIEMDGAGVIPDPGDDMYLAGEYRLTSTDLSNKYVLYEDVSFDPLLGDALYSNENQEGPLSVRFQPPVCRDIASFGSCSFFANTTEKQRLVIKLLAVDSSGIGTYKGVRVGDHIVIGDLVMEGVLAAAEETDGWNFAVDVTTGAGSEVIRALKTAESLVYKYNQWSNANNGRYAAYNMTTNNDIYGVIMLEEKSTGGSTGAFMGVNRVDAPVQLLPAPVFTSTPSNTLAIKCAISTNGSGVATIDAAANHNLTTGDLVFLAPYGDSTEAGTSAPQFVNTNVPAGVYRVTVVDADEFTITGTYAISQTDADAADTGGYFHKIFDVTSSVWTEARSKNSRQPNRLMWSSPFEPECAPPANSTDIGAADKAIVRIVPTQDSLFIFKEDGVWRLKGQAGDWEIVVLDKATIIAAPETPAVVDGRVFVFSTCGVVAVDDGGVIKVSGDVGGRIDNYLRSIASNPLRAVYYSACAHGEDKSYIISFGFGSSDVYRYHVPTKTWSRNFFRDAKDASYGTLIGSVFTAKASRYTSYDTQAYAERMVILFSSLSISPPHTVGIERRSGFAIDLCDLDLGVTVSSFDTAANTVTLSSVPTSAAVGDVFLWSDNSTLYVPGGYSTSSGSVQYRAPISAINGNVLTLDVSSNIPNLSTWPAVGTSGYAGTIMQQIRSTCAPSPVMSPDGLSLAKFSEVVASFGTCARFTSASFGFLTETGFPSASSYSDQSVSSIAGFAAQDWANHWIIRDGETMQMVRSFRTGIPRASTTGTALFISISNNRAWEIFDIAGIRLIYTEGDNKTRRSNGLS